MADNECINGEGDTPGNSGEGVENQALPKEKLVNASTNGDGRINSGRLVHTMLIDMVDLGAGCSGDCIGCGAFNAEYTLQERKIRPINEEQLKRNITQEITDSITGTRHSLLELFRKYMTAGVDMEPLESDIFNIAAKMIYELSDNHKSRMITISHGLRCNEVVDEKTGEVHWEPVSQQLARLEELAELMVQDIVPLFVLSIDSQRDKGLAGKKSKTNYLLLKELDKDDSEFMKIIKLHAQEAQKNEGMTDPPRQESKDAWAKRLESIKKRLLEAVQQKLRKAEAPPLTPTEEKIKTYLDLKASIRGSVIEANARFYAATVNALRPAIDAKKRITFSLQGDKNEDSLAYVGITFEIYQHMLDILENEFNIPQDMLQDIIDKVKLRPPRLYTGTGRAKNLLKIVEQRYCRVIPDEEFARTEFRSDDFKVNRGRIKADGTLEIQMNRPKMTYNDTVDSDDNPWAVVDLSDTTIDSIEIKEPADFLERVKLYSSPRYIMLPPGNKESPDLSDVYPLSLIEDKEKLKDIVKKIEDHFAIAGIDDTNRRLCIIEALIPDEEVNSNNEKEETPAQTRRRLAEEVIKAHVPKVAVPKDEKRKMGEILAIQFLLNERGVDVELED